MRPGTACQGSDSVWFLVVLGVVWAAVVGAGRGMGLGVLRERGQQRIRHPAHRPVWCQQLSSAVSVEEIRRRLAAEAAQRPPRVGNITIVPRAVRPQPRSPVQREDREPVSPAEPPDDDESDRPSWTLTGGPCERDQCHVVASTM